MRKCAQHVSTTDPNDKKCTEASTVYIWPNFDIPTPPRVYLLKEGSDEREKLIEPTPETAGSSHLQYYEFDPALIGRTIELETSMTWDKSLPGMTEDFNNRLKSEISWVKDKNTTNPIATNTRTIKLVLSTDIIGRYRSIFSAVNDFVGPNIYGTEYTPSTSAINKPDEGAASTALITFKEPKAGTTLINNMPENAYYELVNNGSENIAPDSKWEYKATEDGQWGDLPFTGDEVGDSAPTAEELEKNPDYHRVSISNDKIIFRHLKITDRGWYRFKLINLDFPSNPKYTTDADQYDYETLIVYPVVKVTGTTDATVNVGQTATFTSSDNCGDGNNGVPKQWCNYQWKKSTNGGKSWSNAPGASTKKTYTTDVAKESDDGTLYKVVVTYFGGTNEPRKAGDEIGPVFIRNGPEGPIAKLTVRGQIHADPVKDAKGVEGHSATFTASSDCDECTVQWKVSTDGLSYEDVSGATSKTLEVKNLKTSYEGYKYRAVFTHPTDGRTATSEAGVLHVIKQIAPTATSGDQNVDEGEKATFKVETDCGDNCTTQWQKKNPDTGEWEDIPGANDSSYTTPPTTEGDNGSEFRVIVKDPKYPNERVYTSEPAIKLTVNIVSVAVDTDKTEVEYGADPADEVTAEVSTNVDLTSPNSPYKVKWVKRYGNDWKIEESLECDGKTCKYTPSDPDKEDGVKLVAQIYKDGKLSKEAESKTITVLAAPILTPTFPVEKGIGPLVDYFVVPVDANKDAVLSVEAKANPEAALTWYQGKEENGDIVWIEVPVIGGQPTATGLKSISTPTLLVPASVVKDGLKYKVVATNTIGQQDRTATTFFVLRVKDATTPPAAKPPILAKTGSVATTGLALSLMLVLGGGALVLGKRRRS